MSSGNKQDDAYKFINTFLTSNLHKDKSFFMMNKIDNLILVKQNSINDFIPNIDPIKLLNYEKSSDLKFSLDYNDSVVLNVTKICYLSTKFKYI